MFSSGKVILETDTALEHYTVVERIYEGRQARLLFSGQQQAAQSGIPLDDNPDLLFDYNQRFLELASARYPARVLVIGGGAFTLPMALLTALPTAQIDVVELDAGLEPIARQYFGLHDSERLHLDFDDGRYYLEKSRQQYDLIIVDAFSQLQIPRPLLTKQAVELIYRHLNASGVAAINLISAYQGRSADILRSQLAAYQQLFARVDVFPAAHGLTSWLPQNLVLVGQKTGTASLAEYIRFAPITPPVTTIDEALDDRID